MPPASRELYHVWYAIRRRCTNPRDKDFHNYGGRGIKLHPPWHDYRCFRDDIITGLGHRPSPRHSLDRIDNDGDYEPGNLRWALPRTQIGNRRKTITVRYLGETKPLSEWARATGIDYGLLHTRLFNLGWTVEDALQIQPQMGRNHR